MKNNNSKFTLSLPGEIACNYSFNTKTPEIFKEFETVDILLQYLYELSDSQFGEGKRKKANLLLDFYFAFFRLNYIDKSHWNYFVSIFNIETPRNKDFYNFESSDDQNRDLEPKDLLNICIDNSTINKTETKKAAKLLLDKNNEYIHISTDYFCDTTADMLVATINYLFTTKPNATIKKCENCGKLFVPKNSTAKYCNRTSPQFDNKTCKQAMDAIKKEEALSDPIKLLYKKVYNTLYSSYHNNKTKDNKKLLESFKKKNIVMKKKYELEKLSQEEYIEWLKSFYRIK